MTITMPSFGEEPAIDTEIQARPQPPTNMTTGGITLSILTGHSLQVITLGVEAARRLAAELIVSADMVADARGST